MRNLKDFCSERGWAHHKLKNTVAIAMHKLFMVTENQYAACYALRDVRRRWFHCRLAHRRFHCFFFSSICSTLQIDLDIIRNWM
ncbi:unnamed protein product [Lactuca virosa]|uniref:Uncharacterized protein n=1 Tax=Lactuca virosa TaxID=75947 RepID=A0AAU9LF55_9ASTR|nr:unnamed protein product [Lactuca virosa]